MRLNKGLMLVLGFAIALTPALADTAAAWNFGDVFAAVGNGRVNRYAADGSFVEQLNTGMTGFTTGMAFDASSNLYVTGFSAANVARFNSSGTLLGTFGSNYSQSPESIVFDKSGNAYVGQADGNADILKFNSAGVHQASYDVNIEVGGRGSDWIDLAADQKTMYYTSENEAIRRYDVSTGTQLSDFAGGLGRPAFALRILGDGGVLVATRAMVKRLDAAGNVIQTYDIAGEDTWFALNLDGDGTSFWSGSYGTGKAYKFDIATGVNSQVINTGSSAFYGLTIFGERTQGGPDPIPEPGTMALLGLGLAGIGFRLRRKS